MGSDGNGWTLNSIGYNRGFTDVLKKLMDYKVSLNLSENKYAYIIMYNLYNKYNKLLRWKHPKL